MSDDQRKITVGMILLLALVLRIVGINNGFPFIFHPDEPTIVRSALEVRFYPNPGHFDWPHLYIYLNYFLYMGFAYLRDMFVTLGGKEFLIAKLPILWNDDIIFYALTRLFSATLGALTIIPVYLTGKRTFNEKVGILAALTFAVLPFHVKHSHYALPDVPMVFFLAWGMYFASNILQQSDINNYAASGVYLGLSASTKYNGALGSFMVPLAHVIRSLKLKENLLDFKSISSLLASAIMFFIAFLAGTPYAVLDYKTFMIKSHAKGALWQFTNVGSVPFGRRLPQFVDALLYKLPDDFGYTILAGFGIVIVFLLVHFLRRTNRTKDLYTWFFCIVAIVLIFYISGFATSRSHYFMISYPFIAVVFGVLLDEIFEFFEKNIGFITLIFYTFLLGIPFYFSLVTAISFFNPNTQNIMYNWLKDQSRVEDILIYSNGDLKPVFDKLPNQSLKGYANLHIPQSGYVIVTDDTQESKFGLLKYQSKLKQEVVISNNLRVGPEIKIYSFNK